MKEEMIMILNRSKSKENVNCLKLEILIESITRKRNVHYYYYGLLYLIINYQKIE